MSAEVALRASTDPSSDDAHEAMFQRRGCCFWMPCLGQGQPAEDHDSVWWQQIRTAEVAEERWWRRGWKKVREWSEIVAGPRWKTFIRRFGRNHHRGGCVGCGGGGAGAGGRGKFHYDPLSYALNFDEGRCGQNSIYDEDCLKRDFSTRYASIPAAAAAAATNNSKELGRSGVYT